MKTYIGDGLYLEISNPYEFTLIKYSEENTKNTIVLDMDFLGIIQRCVDHFMIEIKSPTTQGEFCETHAIPHSQCKLLGSTNCKVKK